MKKNVLKKLICTTMAVLCIAGTIAPVLAVPAVTTTEAATTKTVTTAYKYHLEGFDKKGNDLFYSKTSFYKDLSSLPSVGMGKTTVNVPAVTKKVKSLTQQKGEELYRSFLRFKAPKTGTYVCTITNLNGTDDKSLRAMSNVYFDEIIKKGKKYGTESPDTYTVGDYDQLYENNYLEKLRTMMDAYEKKHPDYAHYLSCDYASEETYVENYLSNKIKFTVKLKKGETYLFVVDNAGMTTLMPPRHNSYYHIDSQTCLCGGNYKSAYSFDMEIKLKAKKK